jgi:stalled ribosome rescue protein Dom34
MKKNKEVKRVGVYLDHQAARLMEPVDHAFVTSTVESEFTPEEQEYARAKSESIENHKEQYQQRDYYERIADLLASYDDILLFGPSKAKNELHNLLREDKRFKEATIDVQSTDKMPMNQQEIFVRDHFVVNP